MSRENHQTLVIVTHDIEIAAYADKIYHIIDGQISAVEDNRSKQIIPADAAEEVAENCGSGAFEQAREETQELTLEPIEIRSEEISDTEITKILSESVAEEKKEELI